MCRKELHIYINNKPYNNINIIIICNKQYEII